MENTFRFIRFAGYDNSQCVRQYRSRDAHAWAVKEADVIDFVRDAYESAEGRRKVVAEEIVIPEEQLYLVNAVLWKDVDNWVCGRTGAVEPTPVRFDRDLHLISCKWESQPTINFLGEDEGFNMTVLVVENPYQILIDDWMADDRRPIEGVVLWKRPWHKD